MEPPLGAVEGQRMGHFHWKTARHFPGGSADQEDCETTAAIWKMLQEIRPRGTIDMLLQWHRIARSSKGSTKDKASVEEHFDFKT